MVPKKVDFISNKYGRDRPWELDFEYGYQSSFLYGNNLDIDKDMKIIEDYYKNNLLNGSKNIRYFSEIK
ncbi:MAG: hypothetical protein GQ557_01010 [Mycoplasmataceae bacterium]|nr:hypothetical protein [Mycoplasmataceae bacterium]